MNELRVDFRWVCVEREPGQTYLYPETLTRHVRENYSKAFVYRWAIFRQEPDVLAAVYIGEAEDLARRLKNYLAGHQAQSQVRRVKLLLDKYHDQGRRIELQTLSLPSFTVNGVGLSVAS